MTEPRQLSSRALAGLSLSYLLTALAIQMTSIGGTFDVGFADFGLVQLPFIVSIGLTPLIAMLVCRRAAWPALIIAHALTVGGAAFLFFVGSSVFATFLMLSIISVGYQILTATLLVNAWRSQRTVTALLAAIFVLPRVINPITSAEVLATERLFDRTPLLITAMALLLTSSAAALLVRDETPNHLPVREVDRTLLIGASLGFLGFGITASLRSPFDSGVWSGIGILVTAAGLAVLLTRQRPSDKATQLNLGLLSFGAAALVLITGIRFTQGITLGQTGFFSFLNLQSDVNIVLWSRIGTILVLAVALPIIIAIGRADIRYVSIGALLAAASGPIFVFFVLADLDLSLSNFLLLTVLNGTGELVVLAGAVTFALRQRLETSVEAAAVIVLAGFVLLERFAVELVEDLIVIDLFESNFEDLAPLELFVITSSVALVWIAAWLAFRPLRSEDPADPTLDSATKPHAMIER